MSDTLQDAFMKANALPKESLQDCMYRLYAAARDPAATKRIMTNADQQLIVKGKVKWFQ